MTKSIFHNYVKIGSHDYVYAGSMVYNRAASGSLSLDCVLTESGRLAVDYGADGSTSYRPLIHVTDHLGSVRAVVDASTGAVIERNDYLPFGQRRTTANTTSGTASGSNASPNRWFFSGKESQSFLSADIPLLDFGARMYDPTTARWTAIDPMADEYFLSSPYSYCSGNPICIIDPFGKDEWDINKKGIVVAYRQNKDDDVINIVENDGYGKYNQSYFINANGDKVPLSKTFTYGTFANKNNDFSSTDLHSGIELFSFLSKETSVEYGLIVTLDNMSYIHTDNKKNGISIVPMAKDISEKGETVTSIIHSHPDNTIPSGFSPKNTKGDKFAAAAFTESHGFPVDNYVYQPKYNRLIQYTKDRIIPGALFWNTIFLIY